MRPFVLTLLLLCTVPSLSAQAPDDIRISEVFRKVPLGKVLKSFEEKYNVRFAYDNDLVQNVIVALRMQNVTLPEALELLLRETALTFQRVGNNVIILPRPRPEAVLSPEAKTIRLSGYVVDGDSEETLPQATITVRGTNIATTTNNDGYFAILSLPADTCTLEVRYLGYLTKSIKVDDLDTNAPQRIRLKSDMQILNEVVVLDTYNQAVLVEEQPGALVFNARSLSSLPTLGEQDLSRTMQLMPGVSATDESSSGMIIRGSHPSYNLTMLDGMTIYQQDHFFGAFSIINADIIKDVRVHKGMFDARYGGRASGVVDITTKNGNAVKPAFNVKANFINVKATAEIPLSKKWSLFMGARRSFTDVVRSSVFKDLFAIARTTNDQVEIFRFVEGLAKPVTPRYFFFDANTKLTFRASTRDVLSLSLYTSSDNMRLQDSVSVGTDEVFIVDRDEVTRWGNNGMSLRWGRQWSDRYYTNMRVSGSDFFRHYDYNQQIQLGTLYSEYVFGLENNINDLTYALDNEWTLRDDLSVQWGLLGTRHQTHIRIRDRLLVPDELPDETDMEEDNGSWQHALYGSVTFSPIPRLTATAGMRLVHYDNETRLLYGEPRITGRYRVTEQLNLKAGYGRSHQFITQLFYNSPTGSVSGINENFWMLSRPYDERYPVIASDHGSAGATFTSTQFTYDAEVFYKVSRGVIIDEDLNAGTVRACGLDLMVQKTSGIHRGWIAYSLGSARQSHPYILNGRDAPSWQDQRHEFKLVSMLMLGRWNVSSTFVYGSGKPYPRYTVQYHRDNMGVIDDYDVVLDYNNKSRLPAYASLDLSAAYNVSFNSGRKLEVGLSIHNVMNRRNVKTRRIDTSVLDETLLTNEEREPVYADVVLLGFSPTFFASFSF